MVEAMKLTPLNFFVNFTFYIYIYVYTRKKES